MTIKSKVILASTIFVLFLLLGGAYFSKSKKSEPPRQEFLWTHWLQADGEKADLAIRYTHDTVGWDEDGNPGKKRRIVEWFVPQVDTIFRDSAGRKLPLKTVLGQDSLFRNYYLIDEMFIMPNPVPASRFTKPLTLRFAAKSSR